MTHDFQADASLDSVLDLDSRLCFLAQYVGGINVSEAKSYYFLSFNANCNCLACNKSANPTAPEQQNGAVERPKP